MALLQMLLIAAAALVVFTRQAEAGGLELSPTLSVGEEYTDNVFETVDGRKTEWITRLRPGLVAGYHRLSITVDAAYQFDYRVYAKGTHGDEGYHNLDLRGSCELLDNLLFVDFTDLLHRAMVNVSKDVATESLLAPQTSQNIATVSPYLMWHPTAQGRLKTAYTYADTRYWQGVGDNKREHRASADYQHEVSEQLSLLAGYAWSHAQAGTGSYGRQDVSGGFRYGTPERGFFGQLGNSWIDFTGRARTSHLFWDVGVSRDFGRVNTLLETKVQDAQDPLTLATRELNYSGKADVLFERGAAGLQVTYSDFYITESGHHEYDRLSLTTTGRYELRPRLTASAGMTADRFSPSANDDYRFRITANVGLSYGFFNDLTALQLSYSYRLDRHSLSTPTGEKVANNVLLEANLRY